MRTESLPTPHASPGLAWWPLLLALGLLAVLTVYPVIATDREGHPDHLLAMLLLAAMSAGFVHGVGFLPRNQVLGYLFSGAASGAYLLLAGLRLMQMGRLPGWVF